MSKDNPLLPLEYCRIDRAARLFGCEVEDILHWCSIGAIEGSAWLSAVPAYPVFVKDNSIVEDEDEYDEQLDLLFYPDETSGIRPQPASIGCNAKLTRRYGTHGSPTTIANGLWSLDKSLFEHMLLEQKAYLSEWSLLPTGFDYGCNFVSIVVESSADEAPIEPNQVWLIRRDLILLKKHIESGDQIPKEAYLQTQRASHTPPPQHPIAEYHAANRERVLAAAIRAKLNPAWQDDPDDTAVDWATKVINYEHALFDDKKCPLALGTVERLLSTAMTTGRPRKDK
ncbi:hypothetical protein AAW02_03010 [Aeromonas dhakensis]|uniref:hypothetical protein n=1 Tax=Aeromonas dhakensis TaxID=196024 RepID=UPI000C0BC515|nr:hypothetical protein [Aeromonas dhakensis]PHS90867.1 hypothetical protein AAW02_03010 [Aeromonas dhakensis]